MSLPPLTDCPRCGKPIRDDVERRFIIPAAEVGEEPIEIVEHTHDRCGKWLWRRQKEKAK